MNRKDDLFNLVHAMTPSEKKHFRLSAAHQKGDKRYLLLFDALLKQESYDLATNLKALNIIDNIKQYNFLKSYLSCSIFKSLVKVKSDSESIIGSILRLKVLYSKGLYDHCSKELKRVKKRALSIEDYTSISELLNLELKLLEKRNTNKLFAQCEIINRQSEKNLYQQSIVAEISVIYSRVKLLYASKGPPRSYEERMAYENELNHPSLKRFKNEINTPLIAKLKLQMCQIMYYLSIDSKAFHYSLSEDALEIIKKHDYLKTHYPEVFLDVVNLRLLSCAYSHETKAFKKTKKWILNAFKHVQFRNKTASLRGKKFYILNNSILINYHKNFNKRIKPQLINEVKNGLQKYNQLLSHLEILHLSYLLSLLCFKQKKFQDALNVIENIPVTCRYGCQSYLEIRLKLLTIVCHFELGDFRLIESLLLSAYRYLLPRKNTLQTEFNLVSKIKKEVSKPSGWKNKTKNSNESKFYDPTHSDHWIDEWVKFRNIIPSKI